MIGGRLWTRFYLTCTKLNLDDIMPAIVNEYAVHDRMPRGESSSWFCDNTFSCVQRTVRYSTETFIDSLAVKGKLLSLSHDFGPVRTTRPSPVRVHCPMRPDDSFQVLDYDCRRQVDPPYSCWLTAGFRIVIHSASSCCRRPYKLLEMLCTFHS
jgi:hypothetical protein